MNYPQDLIRARRTLINLLRELPITAVLATLFIRSDL
jgi:hypothetical protein